MGYPPAASSPEAPGEGRGGGAGGGAVTAARRLYSWGSGVLVVLAGKAERFLGAPARQLANAWKAGVEVVSGDAPDPGGFDVVVDGLVGYSLHGAPRGRLAELIAWTNTAGVPVVSLDLPSGVDADSGIARGAVVRAEATLTLALPKRGLLETTAAASVGELLLADIGVPPVLYAEPSLGLEVPDLFGGGDIVRLA